MQFEALTEVTISGLPDQRELDDLAASAARDAVQRAILRDAVESDIQPHAADAAEVSVPAAPNARALMANKGPRTYQPFEVFQAIERRGARTEARA